MHTSTRVMYGNTPAHPSRSPGRVAANFVRRLGRHERQLQQEEQCAIFTCASGVGITCWSSSLNIRILQLHVKLFSEGVKCFPTLWNVCAVQLKAVEVHGALKLSRGKEHMRHLKHVHKPQEILHGSLSGWKLASAVKSPKSHKCSQRPQTHSTGRTPQPCQKRS